MQATCRAFSRRAPRNTQAVSRWASETGKRWSSSASARQWSTPLAKGLAEAITTTGPISVASYMRQCLTATDGGYYTSHLSGDKDQFGAKGDFITSPEISQVFGELVGIWIVAEWIAQGKKGDGVYLMELGPGRGTLMDDVLRTVKNFKDLTSSIEAIYMVETSPQLRQKQHALLCGGEPLENFDGGYRSVSKHLPSVPIVWAEDLKLVPHDVSKTPFILAHEFFDALPIHVFQSVSAAQAPSITRSVSDQDSSSAPSIFPGLKEARSEWRELVVTPTPPPVVEKSGSDAGHPAPDFELSLSKQPTPHSMLLPASSPRYAALASTPGSTVEISPESQAIVNNLAARIGGGNSISQTASTARKPSTHPRPPPKPRPSGAALILDYGPSSTIPANSLRGIRAHRRVSPFSFPGLVDLSADVDFRGLAESAINASPGVLVHGPVEQGVWLRAMGIEERADVLAAGAGTEERKSEVEGGWKRLVDRGPNGMGRLYKAMAILPYVKGKGMRRPVGFGGDVKLET